jgi:hypothetical protein
MKQRIQTYEPDSRFPDLHAEYLKDAHEDQASDQEQEQKFAKKH